MRRQNIRDVATCSLIDTNDQAAGTVDLGTLLAFTNPNRLLIIFILSKGEHSVGQLAELLGMGQSSTSQHLSILRRFEMVTTRREGQTLFYSLAASPTDPLIDCLKEMYNCDSA